MKIWILTGLACAFTLGFMAAQAVAQDKEGKVYRMTGRILSIDKQRVEIRDGMGQNWVFAKSARFPSTAKEGSDVVIQYVIRANEAVILSD